MQETNPSPKHLEDTLIELTGQWADATREIIHQQLVVTYGSRRGFEEKAEQQ